MSEKKGFFKRLAQGLSKTRDNIASSFDSIFSGFSGIDVLQFIMLIQVNAVITRMAKKFILTILQLELSTCLVAVISDTLGNLVVGYRGRFRK